MYPIQLCLKKKIATESNCYIWPRSLSVNIDNLCRPISRESSKSTKFPGVKIGEHHSNME